MAYEFRYQRRIEFSDTDMAGIVHFANFFKFMEAAEHAFYLSLGLSVHDMAGGRVITWPRVAAECRYRHPLRFEDLIEIHLVVKEKRRKAIRYLFVFQKVGEEPRREYARGSLTVVCAAREAPGLPYKAIEIPEAIGARIESAPAGVLETLETEEQP